MEKETLILLLEIHKFDRKEAELIENDNCTPESINKIMEMAKEKGTTIQVHSLSYFMDLCNNEEINLNEYWITYVNYVKPNN